MKRSGTWAVAVIFAVGLLALGGLFASRAWLGRGGHLGTAGNADGLIVRPGVTRSPNGAAELRVVVDAGLVSYSVIDRESAAEVAKGGAFLAHQRWWFHFDVGGNLWVWSSDVGGCVWSAGAEGAWVREELVAGSERLVGAPAVVRENLPNFKN